MLKREFSLNLNAKGNDLTSSISPKIGFKLTERHGKFGFFFYFGWWWENMHEMSTTEDETHQNKMKKKRKQEPKPKQR